MKIAIVGGTGKEGKGLAARWARAGHSVFVGSREAERGQQVAESLSKELGVALSGGDNAWVIEQADVVLFAIPYGAHSKTLKALRVELGGKVVFDITVPLKPPKVREVHLPEGNAAALEARAILGDDVKLVATLHHVSSVHLGNLAHALSGDVLFCTDHEEAREVALVLLADLGLHPIDAGPLANAVALESLTPVLLYINKKYKAPGAGLRISGLSE